MRMSFVFMLLKHFWVIGFIGFACSEMVLYPQSEIDLSSPPLTPCGCAKFYTDDSCGKMFEDWAIVDHGFIKAFNETDYVIEIKDRIENICQHSEDVKGCKMVLHMPNVVVLGTGEKTVLEEVLQSKSQTVFCPGSLAPSLKQLILSNIKHVHFSSESIAERTNPLKIQLHSIHDDLVFPIGWYDYQYKVLDVEEDMEGSVPYDNFTNMALELSLFEVGNVTFNTNSIRMSSVKFDVSHAKHVFIDSFAVSEVDSLSSLISLRKVDHAEIKSSWGEALFIESAKIVDLPRGSIPNSVNYVDFKDIQQLTCPHSILELEELKSISALNVSFWIFPVEIISPYNVELIVEQTSTKKPKNMQPKFISIVNTNMHLIGPKSIKLTATKVSIRNSTFTCTEPKNISLLFIAYEFELENNKFPEWITFCQLKTPLICQNLAYFKESCPIGFPYIFNESIFEASKCEEINSHKTETMNAVLFSLSGIGIVILLLLIVIFMFIYRQSQLSGKWQPKRVGSTYLSSHQGFSSKHSQILHIPGNDSHISFKFPRHFTGQVVRPYDETLPAVNFYSYEDLRVLREQTQQNIERDLQKLAAVQLLNIRPCLEETQDRKEIEETQLKQSFSSSNSSESPCSED